MKGKKLSRKLLLLSYRYARVANCDFHVSKKNFFPGQPHTKNWRPQILVLIKLNDDLMPKYRKMFAFVSQLKAGKGLTVCMGVIPGDYTKRQHAAITAKQNLRKYMEDERVKGFVDVLVTKNVPDGLSNMYVILLFREKLTLTNLQIDEISSKLENKLSRKFLHRSRIFSRAFFV